MTASGASSRAGRVLHDALDTEVTLSHHASQRARLVSRVTEPVSNKRPVRLATAVALAALVLGTVLWMRPGPADPLFTVGADAPGEVGTYYSPPTGQELALQFGGGNRVRVMPGGGARVSHLDRSATTLLVEGGRVHVEVQPHPERRWQVAAGPYSVRVTGTAFWVAWRAEQNQLAVEVERGSVVITGPRLESGVTLSAGQRFETQVVATVGSDRKPPGGDVSAVAVSPAPELSAALPPKPTPVRAPSPAAEVAAETDAPTKTPEPSWSELAKLGQYKRIVELADARGVDAVLSGGRASDLAALADAARYTGRGGLATRALQAERGRFSGSSRAKSAAFVLGRMADDGGNPGAALVWYDTYLSETPGGALAAEAFGRRMLALQRVGRSGKAKTAATQYLSRFPKGPYAAQAEKLANR